MKYKFKIQKSKVKIDVFSRCSRKIFIVLFLLLTLPFTLYAVPSASADVFDYSSVSAGQGVFNVKTMGAKGDGVTDDTAIINQAIAETRYPKGGGVVYLPEGRYLVTGIDATVMNGTTITGDGPDKTFIISNGFHGPVIDTLGSNYLTIAKLSIGLKDNATADAGIALSVTGPYEPTAPVGASATANSIDQVHIEDTGVSSSFNIAALLMGNVGDTHIHDSKFISNRRATTPAVILTGNAKILGLRSQYATVIDPAGVFETYGAANPTDNTFYNVLIRKGTAGSTGALVIKGAEVRVFDSKIESADPNGVVASGYVLGTMFYNTQILPLSGSKFSGACIKLPPRVAHPNMIQVHGLSFDPPSCPSLSTSVEIGDLEWTFRAIYPPSGFTRDIRGSRDIPLSNVPHFYTADAPFPAAPPPFENPAVSASPSLSPSPSSSASLSPSPSSKPGDIDGDNDVDIFDYNMLVTDFGKTGSGIKSDLDRDGDVDIFDYNIVISSFGK